MEFELKFNSCNKEISLIESGKSESLLIVKLSIFNDARFPRDFGKVLNLL